MPFSLLAPDIQQFITEHIDADVQRLALQKNPFYEQNWALILEQIVGKQKAKDKLPTWFHSEQILYPAKISIEQTSSEKTAAYKASLISGNNIIDLTGGFGVDDFYFTKAFKSVAHCEANENLSAIAKHNFEQLEVKNCSFYTGNSTDILLQLDQRFDWIYVDPSRRHDQKGKVFMLQDCEPNVPKLKELYFKYSDRILIKTAPILDLIAGLKELKNVRRIHIVAVENEVKELLWEIEKGFDGTVQMNTVNLKRKSNDYFDFNLHEVPQPDYSLPKTYLYEPNAAIMKSGGFDALGVRFGLGKLHPHSQLFTADDLRDFPGRIFQIEQGIAYHKNEMKTFLEGTKANITVRNFPDSVAVIRKKWKISDGGNRYCFFTTDVNNRKIVLICAKIEN